MKEKKKQQSHKVMFVHICLHVYKMLQRVYKYIFVHIEALCVKKRVALKTKQRTTNKFSFFKLHHSLIQIYIHTHSHTQ